MYNNRYVGTYNNCTYYQTIKYSNEQKTVCNSQ